MIQTEQYQSNQHNTVTNNMEVIPPPTTTEADKEDEGTLVDGSKSLAFNATSTTTTTEDESRQDKLADNSKSATFKDTLADDVTNSAAFKAKTTSNNCEGSLLTESSKSVTFKTKAPGIPKDKDVTNFPVKLAELMVQHRATKALVSACNVGVFDFLTEGPQTVTEIAKHCGTSENGMSRLLDACVALDLLWKLDSNNDDDELEEESFELTEQSRRYLTKESPEAMRGEIACIDMEYMLISNMEHAVREGTTQWPRTLGVPAGGNLFDFVYANEMFTLQFLSGMHGVSNLASPILVENIDLSEFTEACDLGGGTGAFAYHAVTKYPRMKMAVLELPPAAKASVHFIPPGLPEDQLSRVKFIPGDFFQGDLPPAQLYVMGRILHNWGTALGDVLLKKVYESLPPGGAVLLVEALLDDDKRGPVRVHMESLVMLAATGEGKERSGKEYTKWLTKHGFTDVQVYREGTLLDGVLARKPRN